MRVQRDMIFKGCTRPAMVMGVPIGAFVCTFMVCGLLGVWASLAVGAISYLFAIAAFTAAMLTMREIARRDDQRFRQIYLWLVLRPRNRNRTAWGATSYSPTRFRKPSK